MSVPKCLVMIGLFLVTVLCIVATAQAAPNPRYASIVVDVESGDILSAANADAARYPASLTKMMTLYLLFEALEEGQLSLGDRLPVSAHAAAQPPSKLWVRRGGSISVKDAILAMIVRSANDVAVVVGEALGGSETAFAHQMTAKARELGMADTTFRNASGLPDAEQVTTARDMARLSVHLMQDFPQYYGYFARTQFVYKGKTIPGHNNLLDSYPGTDGLKTGYIDASGFNVATSAVHNGRRLVSVVMGGFTARSRDTHMASLLDRGFVRASLLDRGDWIAKADLFEGRGAAAARASSSPTKAVGTSLAVAEGPTPVQASASGAAQASSAPADDPIRRLIAQGDAAATPAVAQGWAVQVGAFSNRNSARLRASQAADYLSSDIGQATISVTETQGEQAMYRARVVDLQEDQARHSCRQLASQGMECVVVAGVGG